MCSSTGASVPARGKKATGKKTKTVASKKSTARTRAKVPARRGRR